jgi:hypothetical protein
MFISLPLADRLIVCFVGAFGSAELAGAGNPSLFTTI